MLESLVGEVFLMLIEAVDEDIDLMDSAESPAGAVVLLIAGTGLAGRAAAGGNLVLETALGALGNEVVAETGAATDGSEILVPVLSISLEIERIEAVYIESYITLRTPEVVVYRGGEGGTIEQSLYFVAGAKRNGSKYYVKYLFHTHSSSRS